MTLFTLGFIFTSDLQHVLLITKNRPAWQAGKVNGVGGKTEPGETAVQCVSREVYEESGLLIPAEHWQPVGEMLWVDWSVAVFATVYPGSPSDPIVQTDEIVAWEAVANLPSNVISNLRWLIPLAQDVLTTDSRLQVVAHYTSK